MLEWMGKKDEGKNESIKGLRIRRDVIRFLD